MAKSPKYGNFLKKVKDTIDRYDMLQKGDRVLVAVSGGPDSVCLLKVLSELSGKYPITIKIANMDHGLRGKESEKDSLFVKDLAGRMVIPYIHKKLDLKTADRGKFSWEENARKERYAFLLRTAEDEGCNVVATGHNMDDQAETVMMRVLYGSSFYGITGIPPVRTEDGIRIIRPLIRSARPDIMAFLSAAGSDFVVDRSNLDVKFLRNRMRHEILPFLARYNPKIRRALVNLSDTMREDLDFIRMEKLKMSAGEKSRKTGGAVSIKIKDVVFQPRALRKELFKELFQMSGGDIKALTYRHWMDMDHFLRTAEKAKSLDLPGGISMRKTATELVFARKR